MAHLSTSITSVAVYTDRARVVRSGTIALEPGLHDLEVTRLPLKLNQDSVRSNAQGTARARLLGVQLERVFHVETQAEQVRALEKELEAIQDELRGLELRAELVRQNRANLNALAGHTEIYATALASGETGVEAQLALFDGLRTRVQKLDGELMEITALKRDAERRLEKVKKELDRWRNAPRREENVAIVEVEVFQPGELTVELSYVVAAAGWQPLYDLRLVEENGGAAMLEFGYLAQVTQRTGEPWEDVNLILSTARPALAGTLPELDPWYVQPLPPPPPQAAPHVQPAAMQMMKARAFEADVAAGQADRMAAPAEVAVASVEASAAAVNYHVTSRVGVPSDGAPHKVTVAQFRLTPDLDYVTAPKIVEAVYRRAKVANDSPYTLLPGLANLFAGSEYFGSTRLELIAPEGEIELYLGVDDRIKVERELKRRDVDKRLIGNKRRVSFGYEITLENLLSTPAKVDLQDQIPVARHEDIKVKLESADPQPAEQTRLNILNWKLNLSPKEKRVVRFDFSVEYPQGMEIIGLA